MKLLLVGCGAMGSALKDGWAQKCPNIAVTVVTSSHTPPLESAYDVILFAVKPAVLLEAASTYRRFVAPTCTFISIAAGISLAQLKEALGKEALLIRAMPNLPVTIGHGMTALAGTTNLCLAEHLFQAVGKTVCLDESLIDVSTAISGSGPAYFFYLAECLAKAGQALGLAEKEALLMAHQTLKGAGSMITDTTHAADLRARVTSPGGTTEAALRIFSSTLESLTSTAVKAAVERAETLRSKQE